MPRCDLTSWARLGDATLLGGAHDSMQIRLSPGYFHDILIRTFTKPFSLLHPSYQATLIAF